MKLLKKLIWKFIYIFPNQGLKFSNVFSERGKIIADRKKLKTALWEC